MGTFSHYVKQVRASGKQYFTVDEAIQFLVLSRKAALLAAARLKKRTTSSATRKDLRIDISVLLPNQILPQCGNSHINDYENFHKKPRKGTYGNVSIFFCHVHR